MTSKERMIIAMKNGKPDYVPVAPDISNMIPCRLTGKPFWDIYLYQDPPRWQAYINAVKYFGFDGWLDSVPIQFEYEQEESKNAIKWHEAIVKRTSERIYTRYHAKVNEKEQWSNYCNVYYIADPPTHGLPLSKVGLPESIPTEWEDVNPRTQYNGLEAYYVACELMGDDGVVGLAVGLPGLNIRDMNSIYKYYDNRDQVISQCELQGQQIIRRTLEIVKLKPDYILIGISGHMISNPESIFRELSLPTLKAITAICKENGIPSQIHCCGPEYDLVRISAEETDLTSINPLEEPPMGDCNLAKVKKEFGKRLSLMGNLHTTDVMLRGSLNDVEKAAKKAIDDAGYDGGFILSTGDQCGRDTPDKNIFKLIEVARNYGKY
ncbi:MAG: uroporphyrinogen decarboxylase family protein [bacterium]